MKKEEEQILVIDGIIQKESFADVIADHLTRREKLYFDKVVTVFEGAQEFSLAMIIFSEQPKADKMYVCLTKDPLKLERNIDADQLIKDLMKNLN